MATPQVLPDLTMTLEMVTKTMVHITWTYKDDPTTIGMRVPYTVPTTLVSPPGEYTDGKLSDYVTITD